MSQIFRLQHNTPETFVNRSRDFQMMCNTFDVMNGGVKFDIDSIAYQNDTLLTRESMLPYLQHKLGFFTNVNIHNEDLRKILRAFPQLVRYKGSQIGIEKAIYLYLHLLDSHGDVSVTIINEPQEKVTNPGYVIKIEIEHILTNIDILDAILSFIIPSGYNIEYYFFNEYDVPFEPILERDTIKVYFVDSMLNDQVRPIDGVTFDENYPINAVSLSSSVDEIDNVFENELEIYEIRGEQDGQS